MSIKATWAHSTGNTRTRRLTGPALEPHKAESLTMGSGLFWSPEGSCLLQGLGNYPRTAIARTLGCCGKQTMVISDYRAAMVSWPWCWTVDLGGRTFP